MTDSPGLPKPAQRPGPPVIITRLFVGATRSISWRMRARCLRTSGREVSVTIDLKAGDARATVWTNDLTHDYVHENSAYSS